MTEQINETAGEPEGIDLPGEEDDGGAQFAANLLGIDMAEFKAIIAECEAIASDWENVEITDAILADAISGMSQGLDELFGDNTLARLQETLVPSGVTTQGLVKIRDGLSLLKTSLDKYGPNMEWLRQSQAEFLANTHFNERMSAIHGSQDDDAVEATDAAGEA